MKTKQIQFQNPTDSVSPKWLGWPLLFVLLCMMNADLAGQNTIHIRNCTEKILHISSYNEWDNTMNLPYQGNGTATLLQMNSILAQNGGAGETGEVQCGTWHFFQTYDCCKVKFTCGDNTPCLEVTERLEAGNWVYFSESEIVRGDECYKIGGKALNALDNNFEYGLQDKVLLRTDNSFLMWQADGNLVLYVTLNNTGAIWSTGTNGKGKRLAFQGDGNLVIYGDSGPVWASNTADAQKGGKGGRKLVLRYGTGLVIINQDYDIIWRGV